jgi:o-succinylbenzoate synthase
MPSLPEIFFHKYKLPWGRQTPGALIKIKFEGVPGYADLHPLAFLGDADVDTHLQSIKTSLPTRLAQNALEFAKYDHIARQAKQSLFASDALLENNYLLFAHSTIEEIQAALKIGFTTFKLKCGQDWLLEQKLISAFEDRPELKLRLDFNSQLTEQEFIKYSANISSRVYIEYIEDPTPYHQQVWERLSQKWQLAVDLEFDQCDFSRRPAAHVIIFKPARQQESLVVQAAHDWRLDITVTSSMDHPVGALHAYAAAGRLKHKNIKLRVAGCATWPMNEMKKNKIFESITLNKSVICVNESSGLGLEDYLNSLDWIKL